MSLVRGGWQAEGELALRHAGRVLEVHNASLEHCALVTAFVTQPEALHHVQAMWDRACDDKVGALCLSFSFSSLSLNLSLSLSLSLFSLSFSCHYLTHSVSLSRARTHTHTHTLSLNLNLSFWKCTHKALVPVVIVVSHM